MRPTLAHAKISTTLTYKGKVFRPKSDAKTPRTPKAVRAKCRKPLRYLRFLLLALIEYGSL
jgi:hypothetical protein